MSSKLKLIQNGQQPHDRVIKRKGLVGLSSRQTQPCLELLLLSMLARSKSRVQSTNRQGCLWVPKEVTRVYGVEVSESHQVDVSQIAKNILDWGSKVSVQPPPCLLAANPIVPISSSIWYHLFTGPPSSSSPNLTSILGELTLFQVARSRSEAILSSIFTSTQIIQPCIYSPTLTSHPPPYKPSTPNLT